MDLEDAERRYHGDPEFRAITDMILHGMMGMKFTPSDIRDAAMLASIKFETIYRKVSLREEMDILERRGPLQP